MCMYQFAYMYAYVYIYMCDFKCLCLCQETRALLANVSLCFGGCCFLSFFRAKHNSYQYGC